MYKEYGLDVQRASVITLDGSSACISLPKERVINFMHVGGVKTEWRRLK
jgi:hypothetical protein